MDYTRAIRIIQHDVCANDCVDTDEPGTPTIEFLVCRLRPVRNCRPVMYLYVLTEDIADAALSRALCGMLLEKIP